MSFLRRHPITIAVYICQSVFNLYLCLASVTELFDARQDAGAVHCDKFLWTLLLIGVRTFFVDAKQDTGAVHCDKFYGHSS